MFCSSFTSNRIARIASAPFAWAVSISRSWASVRLADRSLVIPRSSPPASDLKAAPRLDPMFLDRTVIPNTSPITSVTSYPGRSFIVLKIKSLPLTILVRSEGLHTVCEEAGCPNIFECWEDREATFLIGGDQCTRRCDFCQIDTGRPAPLDAGEPRRVAESVASMGLKYATVTGVARDDLPDGGAWLYAETCRQIHAAVAGCGVELLIPDFNAYPDRLAEVFGAQPEVLAHNIETVPRIFRRIRPGFRYPRSLDVLRAAREAGLVTKSNLILGLGEERHEITEAMKDLRAAGCDLLTITQYLRPTPRHHPVERWVKPEEFVELREEAE